MIRLVLLLVASAAWGQTWQPNVSNARFEARPFSGDLGAQMRTAGAAWFGYAVKATPGEHQSCCWNNGYECGCSLEGRPGTAAKTTGSKGPVQLEGTPAVAVLFRVDSQAIQKVQVYSLDCQLDAGGLRFIWITGVAAEASVSYLEKLAEADESNRIVDGVIFAISRHDIPQALEILIRMTRRDASPRVREQALFWLAQRAGERAAATIQDAITNDPDTEIKKRAVFALSQLPHDEGVPKLIEVARTQRNPEVRKQAFFWLGQSRDPRALAFIQDVLLK